MTTRDGDQMVESDHDYHRRMLGWIEDAYVAADARGDVLGGSGSGGSLERWELKRRVIASAFDRDGDWLDVGCANGLLMETLTKWAGEAGQHIEPYGLEISARIAEAARRRYPRWAERISTGNVMEFAPPRRFDYVTLLAEFVPELRRPAMVRRVLDLFLKPRGRLVLSSYRFGAFIINPRAPLPHARSAAEMLREWGFQPIGEAEVNDADGSIMTRVAWLDSQGSLRRA